MTSWQELGAFQGVDLGQSRVRRWSETEGALVLELQGFLLPTHPAYEPPVPGATVCCKPARLVFPFPWEIRGLRSMMEARSTQDQDEANDFGTIEDLAMEADGRYRVSGAFGQVTVQSMAVRFEITSQRQCMAPSWDRRRPIKRSAGLNIP